MRESLLQRERELVDCLVGFFKEFLAINCLHFRN